MSPKGKLFSVLEYYMSIEYPHLNCSLTNFLFVSCCMMVSTAFVGKHIVIGCELDVGGDNMLMEIGLMVDLIFEVSFIRSVILIGR